MDVLSYRSYNVVKGLKAAWLKEVYDVNEGIQYVNDDLGSEKIIMDFNQDLPNDVVKLKDPIKTRPGTFRVNSQAQVFAGYSLEKHPDSAKFIEFIKNWEAISDTELKALINHTFPTELKEMNVRVLFVTGSSSPLSVRIAEALRDLYYKGAKIVDIMKAYYGVDIKDIVNWEEYEKAHPKTKKMIDSYIRGGAEAFIGYIKKSSGLQSGARRLLKPGHTIDDYIVSVIKDEYTEWKKNAQFVQGSFKRVWPRFLVVDEFMIKGSTVRGIFQQFKDIKRGTGASTNLKDFAESSILGYVLFSAGDKFIPKNKS